MAGKSLNKVQLIGNLTNDPELKYTPTGVAVCTVGLATNRAWTTDAGEKREEAEFHRLVAWRKLAEICGQYLKKGSKIYVEGHLQTRKWTTKDGQERYTTEVVMDDMIMLDSRRAAGESYTPSAQAAPKLQTTEVHAEGKSSEQSAPEPTARESAPAGDIVTPEDIPF